MSTLFRPALPIGLLLLLAAPAAIHAEEPAPAGEGYFVAPLADVQWQDDVSESIREGLFQTNSSSPEAAYPRVVIESEGEIYVVTDRTSENNRRPNVEIIERAESELPEEADVEKQADLEEQADEQPMLEAPNAPHLAIRIERPRAVRGTLYATDPNDEKVVAISFRVPASEFTPRWREAFLLTRLAHYDRLNGQDIAGGAWFRHQARVTRQALGERAPGAPRGRFARNRRNQMQHTYALVSGGRAVSENLQLDRELPTTEPEEVEEIPLAEIEGVTVQEFDWSELTAGIDPPLDPLASLIPHDQHAVFFPRFSALVQFIDAAKQQGTPVLEAAELRSESAMSLERYQRQMCMTLDDLDRSLGGVLIKSAAITGGDPYFRTGADVALIFEAAQPQALHEIFAARAQRSLEKHPEAEAIEGKLGDVAYSGVRSPTRDLSCYLAVFGDAVVVSNSLYQLERLAAVALRQEKSLAELPEYKFFRQRYALDETETALLILSDATIRRWTGPKWRIATSRRTRAAAVMSEMLAAHLDDVVRDEIEPQSLAATHWVPGVREYTISSDGIHSEAYGTLRFQRPIGEMNLELVTKQEADFYRRWRDGYQRNWSTFFDPIAARIVISEDKSSLDLTVMPLIAGSDYNELIQISKGAKIKPDDGDRHAEALIHAALAIDRDSRLLKSYDNMASMFGNVNTSPLSWIGDSAAIYLDEGAFWGELAAADDSDAFLQKNFHRVPLALDIDVRSRLRLVAFLTGMRTFIEQSAPGMTSWETKEHAGTQYVKVTPTQDAIDEADRLKDAAIYYAPGGSLLITPSEQVMKRSLERRQKRGEANQDEQELQASQHPWLGENFNLQVDRKLLTLLLGAFGERYREHMQRRAWGNLPILNEWKRRFPDEDPVALHQRIWGRKLVSPAGGSYQWDDQWQTMSSTLYGHPGQAKAGPGLPRALEQTTFANFGLTFEEHGLRSHVELHRSKK